MSKTISELDIRQIEVRSHRGQVTVTLHVKTEGRITLLKAWGKSYDDALQNALLVAN